MTKVIVSRIGALGARFMAPWPVKAEVWSWALCIALQIQAHHPWV